MIVSSVLLTTYNIKFLDFLTQFDSAIHSTQRALRRNAACKKKMNAPNFARSSSNDSRSCLFNSINLSNTPLPSSAAAALVPAFGCGARSFDTAALEEALADDVVGRFDDDDDDEDA